jgi:ABC-type nitrate/sulfonate/bicarbonate transport system substrate-binding protein
MHRARLIALAAWAALACGMVAAQESFRQLVGDVAIRPVEGASAVKVPFITWGGDVATFLANGELKTQPGSIYKQAGLNIELTPGDDFAAQVKDYLSGRTPFLRGTFRMLGQASEVIGADPRTKPVVIMQLSWSAGDHIVAREGLKTLNDLKGRKIACQQGGPHVGLLYDSLTAAQLSNRDVQIVWTKDLTGPEGAAEKFRQDPSIDACCVITPDLIGLTGGFDQVGSGAEGTVAGAHVINSTQQMSRSIADVYAVRRDWYDANQEWVKKFVGGYLKASAQVVRLRNEFEKSQRMEAEYRQLLTMAQRIFGEDVLPTLEVDAHGLLLDCNFVGLSGQLSFFRDSGNLSGFDAKLSEALDLATGWGYAKNRAGFDPNNLDYRQIADLAGLKYEEPAKGREGFVEAEGAEFMFGDNLDPNTIVSFSISFEPNQNEFTADRYGAEFQRALKIASTFGNARVVIRGHSDPTKALGELIRAGINNGLIRQTGTPGNYRYFFEGKPLDVEDTPKIVELIESGAFSGGKEDPATTLQAALTLSKSRADQVKEAVVNYARQMGANVDLSQIVPVGAGISDPIIPKPSNMAEARENMRVEFRIVRVDAESIAPNDFDF